MKGKSKKPASYSIVIMPDGRQAKKSFKAPRWALEAFLGLCGLWLIATFVLFGGMMYYRSQFAATGEIRQENAQLKEDAGRINEKLAAMEQEVGRASRLAKRLETAIGVRRGLKTGIGPIAEDDLPKAKKVSLKDAVAAKGEKISFNDVELKMDKLDEIASSVEMRLTQIYEYHKDKLSYWASVPSIWPVRGWVTSEFGFRCSPKGIGSRFHEGIDIAASIGTPIYASGDGVVTFSGYKNGLGKTVIIDHGFGVSTIYGHNSSNLVRAGDRIKRGTNIARVGRTGRSTGPHLHYQIVVDGVSVDPMRYIIENF